MAERSIRSTVRRGVAESGPNVVVRGTTPDVFRVRPEARIVAGRMFERGKREVVVGRGALDQYADMQIGRRVDIRDGAWPTARPLGPPFARGAALRPGPAPAGPPNLQTRATRQRARRPLRARPRPPVVWLVGPVGNT